MSAARREAYDLRGRDVELVLDYATKETLSHAMREDTLTAATSLVWLLEWTARDLRKRIDRLRANLNGGERGPAQ